MAACQRALLATRSRPLNVVVLRVALGEVRAHEGPRGRPLALEAAELAELPVELEDVPLVALDGPVGAGLELLHHPVAVVELHARARRGEGRVARVVVNHELDL